MNTASVLILSVAIQFVGAALALLWARQSQWKPTWLLIATALLVLTVRSAMLLGSHDFAASVSTAPMIELMSLLSAAFLVAGLSLAPSPIKGDRWRQIVESCPDHIVVVARDGKILYLNHSPAGYPPVAELQGTSILDWMPTDQAQQYRQALGKAFDTGVGTIYETATVAPDGSVTWWRTHIGSVNEGKRVAAATIIGSDITETKHAQEALREKSMRLDLVLQQMPAILWTTDMDLRITSAAGAGLTALGDKAQGVGQTLQDYFQAGSADFDPIVHHRRALGGESAAYSLHWASRDYRAHIEPLRDADGSIVGVLGLALDVTVATTAQTELLQERNFTEVALDAARVLLTICDRSGRVLRVSRAFEQATGWSSATLLNQPVWTLIGNELEGKLVERAFSNLATASFPKGTLNHWKTKDGNRLLIEWTHAVLVDSFGEADYVVSTGIDITERQRAELTLAETEQRNRLMLEQVPAVLWTTDKKLNFTTGIGAGLAHLGLKPGQLQMAGVSLYTYFQTEDPSEPNLAAHLKALDGERIEWDTVWLDRDFHAIVEPLHDARGDIIGTIGIALDITARKRAEHSLRESERQYRTLVNGIHELVWEIRGVDLLEGQLIFVNNRVEEILGYSSQDFQDDASLWWRSIHPDDQDAVAKSAEEINRGGKSVTRLYRLRHKNGDSRWLDERVVPELDASSKVTGLIGLARDVTERIRSQEALRASEEFLRMSQQAGRCGSWEWDPSSNHVKWSDEMCRLHGISQEQFGNSLDEALAFIHPDDVWQIHEGMRILFESNEFAPSEYRIVRSDGTQRVVFGRGGIQRDAQGNLAKVIGTVTDVTDYRHVTMALQQSEERFRTLVDYAPEAIVVLDVDSGRFVDANAKACQLFGMDREELFRHGPAELSPPRQPDGMPSREFAQKQVGAAMAGATPQFEWVHLDVNGKEIDCEIFLVRLPSQSANLVRGSIVDISIRKHAQAEQARLAAIIEATSDFVATADDNGRALYLNRAMREGLEVPDEEQSLQSTIADFHPDWAARHILEEGLPGARRDGRWAAETAMRTRSGREIPVSQVVLAHKDFDGAVRFFSTISRDVSEKKHAELLLRESEEFNRQIISCAQEGVVVYDCDFRYQVWNPYMERITGMASSRVLGKSPFEVFPFLKEHGIDQLLERALAGETVHGPDFEYHIPQTNQTGWNVGTVSPLRNASGAIIGVITMLRDITERKRAERALRDSEEELRRLNAELEDRVRLRTAELESANRELEAFSYSVSHDLRAPLRAITGFCNLLVRDHLPQLQGEAVHFLTRVAANAENMGQLVDDLLSFSHLGRQALNKSKVEPDKIIRQVLAEQEQVIRERQPRIIVDALAPCQADPALLKQVFANLIDNALKYSRPRDPAVIEIGSRIDASANLPVYFVKDNGVGFNMRYADKLFGVFQRLHRAEEFEGTGVGLAIVQRIVRRHGGRVWAEAVQNEGATFYFTLEGEDEASQGDTHA